MNVKSMLVRGALCAGMLAGVAMIVGGCEKVEGLDRLTLTPAARKLGPDEQSLSIGITNGVPEDPLAFPIEWRVSNPHLGTIQHNGGITAIYHRTGGTGVNTITARDQFKNEGFSVIEQMDAVTYFIDQAGSIYVIALTASPESPIIMGTATTLSITMTEGIKPPFNWQLLSGPGAVSAGSGSASAVYSSSSPGVGVIRVTDGNGVQGMISIVVQEPIAADPGTPGTGTPPVGSGPGDPAP